MLTPHEAFSLQKYKKKDRYFTNFKQYFVPLQRCLKRKLKSTSLSDKNIKKKSLNDVPLVKNYYKMIIMA